VIHFVSDLRQVGGFLQILQFPPPIKLAARYDITEILLQMALDTIALNLYISFHDILFKNNIITVIVNIMVDDKRIFIDDYTAQVLIINCIVAYIMWIFRLIMLQQHFVYSKPDRLLSYLP
jgi:hypothetical protein